jgi:hypothetical protein
MTFDLSLTQLATHVEQITCGGGGIKSEAEWSC